MIRLEKVFPLEELDISFKSLPAVETVEQVRRLGLSKEMEDNALQGIDGLRDELDKFKARPKVSVNFEDKEITPIMWPLFEATEGEVEEFSPVGVSVSLVSYDMKVIGIQRDLDNHERAGWLGCFAGYMVIPYTDYQKREFPAEINLREEIEKNVVDQLRHEASLSPEEYMPVGLIYLVKTERQFEFVVPVISRLTADEICKRARKGEGTETGLAEREAFPLSIEDLPVLLELPAASQHMFALLLPLFLRETTARVLDWVEEHHTKTERLPEVPFKKNIREMLANRRS